MILSEMSKRKKNIIPIELGALSSRIILVVFTVLSMFWTRDARATHAMGGDISYECIGVDLYRVVLNFYRDCSGIAAPMDCSRLDYTVDAQGCGGAINGCFQFESVQSITPICYSAADLCDDPSGQYGVEWYAYADTFDLSSHSGCGDDWLIEWDLANRNNNITSLIGAGSEQLYISALLNNTLDNCNNSPVFLNDPVPFSCVDQPINYNHGVSDPDGDSLVFSFAPARGENGAALAYSAGYSFDNPILTAGGADAPAIDPVTGTITAVPNQVQFAVVTILVQEYRDQVLIGEFTRDVQFAILPSTFCNNDAPVASGINGTTDYTLEFCADSSFCFDIFTSDANAGDSIYVSWNGGIAGATFTVGPGLQPTATFCWATSSADIGTNLFSVILNDNSCELNGTTSWGYALIVTPPSTPADAGPDQVICATSTTMAGVLPFSQSTRSWTLLSGAGTISNASDPSTLITGLGVGDNVFEWAVDYENCGIERDSVVITVFDSSLPVAYAGLDQAFCLPTTSATLAADATTYPAVGTWSVTAGAGVFGDVNDPSTSVTGLLQGLNTFEWSIDNGPCGAPTTDEISIFIFDNTAPVADAGADQSFCSPVSVATMAANVPVFPATGNWILLSGSGIITTPTSPTSGITGLTIGENVFRWEIDNGPCSPSTTDTVSIFIYDPAAPAANAGVDIEICTPVTSTSLSGNSAVVPAIGTWALVSGTGTITDPNDPLSLISGMSVGLNVFEWTIDNGPCNLPTVDTVTIFLYDAIAPIAAAGPDQEYCTPTNTALLAANAPLLPASGAWTLMAGTGVFTDASDPNTTVTGITVGVNTYRWTIDNGPCPTSGTQDEISVTIYDNNTPIADAGPDELLCSPTSSTTVTANILLGPSSGVWTLLAGTGNVVQPTNPVSLITGLSIGENTFQWTVDNGPCSPPTFDSISIFIFDQNSPVANAGSDQFLCLPNISTNFSGSVPVFPAFGTWSLISGGGTIADINDPASALTALPVGENIFQWTMDNGPCATGITIDQVSIFIFDNTNPIADAGLDQQLCTPVTSTNLTGNPPIIPAVGAWSVISGSGNFSDINDPNATVSGLSVGDNILQWSMNNGPCAPGLTTDQVSIFLFDLNAAPADAGLDVDLCSPLSTYSMTANTPTVPAIGIWTVIQGAGTFSDINDPSALVSNMVVGENIFEWGIDNGICGVSTDLMSIFIFDPNAPAAYAGPDVEFCTPTSSVTMAANSAISPGFGQWTVISGGGIITDPSDPNTSISGLTVGSYTFEWTIDNGPCLVSGTSDQITVLIYDQNGVISDAGLDQEFCSPTNSSTLAANLPTFPAIGAWTVTNGPAVVTQLGNPFSAVTGLAVGENTFEWIIDNGPCVPGVSIDEVSIFIYDASNLVANAGPDQEFCTPTTSATLAGSAVIFPASGIWTVSQGTGLFSDINDPTTDVIGLSVGENIFQWEVDNGPCGASTIDEVSIFIFDQNAPLANAGADQFFCTPTTSTNMTAGAVTIPGVGTWTLLNGSGIFSDPNDPVTGITGLAVGENICLWTVENGPCGAPTQDTVSIFVFDQNALAANAGVDQDLCSPTSTTALNGNAPIFPGVGTWTLLNGTGVFADLNDPLSLVTNLSIGENIFQWEIDNGPCAAPTQDTVSIFVFDNNNANADAGPDQFQCTPDTTTNLEGNAPIFPAQGTWFLIQGTGVLADANDPNTGVTGLTVGENIFLWQVENGPCANAVTTDLVSIFIFDDTSPVADAGPDQQICTPMSMVTMAGSIPVVPSIGTWTLFSGAGVIADPNDPTTDITGLLIGTHVYIWTVDNGPCSVGITTDTVAIEVFDVGAGGSDAGLDQELCLPILSTVLDGNIPVSPAIGTWTLFSGNGVFTDVNDPNTTVTGLTVGENVLEWTISNGTCGAPIGDQVSIFIFDDANPIADAGADQDFCTPVSSATLDGSPVTFPAVGTWTLISGAGVFSDINDPNATISGLLIGEAVCMWTVDNGPCASPTSDTVSIFIFDDNMPVADAGLAQEFCTPTSSTTMSASSIVFPGSGSWSLFSGSGTIIDTNSAVTSITGLTIGENIFVWEVDNGPCLSGITSDTVSIFIFDENAPVADAGIDQEICTPLDSVMMAANTPVFPAIGTWTLLSGTGSIVDPNDLNTWVTGLTVGENQFEWAINNGPCIGGVTTDVVSIFMFDTAAAPASAGPDQDICTPQDFATMAGNAPVAPGVGTWTLVSGTGFIVDVNDPLTEITSLAVGENVFVWEIYNGPCGVGGLTQDTVSLSLFDVNSAPADAGLDQEYCTPTNTTTLNGNVPILPSIGYWILVSGTGVLVDSLNPATDVNGLTVGENIFEWTIDNGSCINSITTDQVSIFIFSDTAANADAGIDQELCTPTNSTFMDANVPIFPATGMWSLSQGSGNIVDLTDPFAEIQGLSIGENIFEWTIDNGPCANGITSDLVSIFVFDSIQPIADAGLDQDLCTPTTSTTMAGSLVLFPATGTWTLLNGVATINDPNDPATMITGLAVGENVFVWIIDNGPCNPPISSDTVSLFLFDADQIDAMAGPDQDFCSPLTSTTMLANAATFPAIGTWLLLNGAATIGDVNDPFSTISDLGFGENIFEWQINNGPCGNVTTDEMSIFLYDSSIEVAYAGEDQLQCQDTVETNLEADQAQGTGVGSWATISGTGVIQDVSDPNTLVTDLEIGDHIFVWTVDNGTCGSTMDTIVVTLINCVDFVIPDAFSPNGDGTNDVLEIPNIQYYPNNTFQVFNRWGSLVFEAGPYVNDWDGRSKSGFNSDKGLPESTYYYILDLGDGSEVLKGFIYLRR